MDQKNAKILLPFSTTMLDVSFIALQGFSPRTVNA